MAAGEDDLYLENLEEFVNDEDKIVTYKWLSRTLSVPANKAKQMLYAFVKAQQEARPDISHSITYIVGGRVEIDGNLVHKYIIVTDEDLEDTKKQFCPVTCVHIYSVQKCKPKDSNCLYTVDYDIIQEHKKDGNRWSHIHCKEAQCLSDRRNIRSSISRTDASSTSKVVNGTSERPAATLSKGISHNVVCKTQKPSNEKTRKGQMSALEMFAKKPNTSSEKKDKEPENTQAVKTEPGSSVVTKKTAASSKPGSMMSFFGKPVAGSSTSKTSEEKKENNKITPSEVENKDKKRVDRPKKSKHPEKEDEEDEEEPIPKKISKRMSKDCDDAEEEPVKPKNRQKKQKDETQSDVNKRKTKKKRAFIRDSDDEPQEEKPAEREKPKEKKSRKKRKRTKELSEDEDSHEAISARSARSSIPNFPPVRKEDKFGMEERAERAEIATAARKYTQKQEASNASNGGSGHSNEDKKKEGDSESSLTNQPPRSSEGARRRKRRKVLTSKTSMNEEGFMVTEKIWESDSTDASDVEQRTEVAAPASKKQAANAREETARSSLSTKQVTKTNKPGKQASLMSFFQKS